MDDRSPRDRLSRLSITSTNAFELFDSISPLWEDKRLVVLLDYDGTLTPIVSNPDAAVLSPATRDTILTLASTDITVGVVSGRSLPKIKNFVDVEGICYAGSHGFDVEVPSSNGRVGRVHQHSADLLPQLAEIRDQLNVQLRDVPGAMVEDNKFSISAHYRNVPQERQIEIEQAVDRMMAQYSGMKKGHGKMVYEIKPDVKWNKGEAVLWVLNALDLQQCADDVFVIYIGDDTTDEDAFAVLLDHDTYHGMGIKVTEATTRSRATMTLRDPDEVFEFLRALLDVPPKTKTQKQTMFRCEHCSTATFKTHEEAHAHEASCTGHAAGQFLCDACGGTFEHAVAHETVCKTKGSNGAAGPPDVAATAADVNGHRTCCRTS